MLNRKGEPIRVVNLPKTDIGSNVM